VLLIFPAAQLSQLLLAATEEYVPFVQATQLADPVDDAKYPIGQLVHTLLLPSL